MCENDYCKTLPIPSTQVQPGQQQTENDANVGGYSSCRGADRVAVALNRSPRFTPGA